MRCRLELAGSVGAGIGEGSLDVAEQLALEQRLGDGAHVHRHHGQGVAAGEAVQLAGQHLLARPVLAGDEDVGIRGGHLLHQFAQPLHGGAVSPIHRVLLLRLLPGRSGTDGRQQGIDELLVVPRLDHEVRGSLLDAAHGQVDVGVGGEEHHGQGGREPFDLVQPVEALVAVVDARREVHVQQQHVPRAFPQHRGQGGGRGQQANLVEVGLQQELQGGQYAAVVVHNQYVSFLLHSLCLCVFACKDRAFV